MELLRPLGELVAIPQPSKPHKSFLSVLVRCRPRVALLHEVAFSFGMRKFLILITDNRLPFPSFRKDLEKYVYPATSPTRESSHPTVEQQRGTGVSSLDSKGKKVLKEGTGPLKQQMSNDRASLELQGYTGGRGESRWRPRLNQNGARPVSVTPGASSTSSRDIPTRLLSIAPEAQPHSPTKRDGATSDACELARTVGQSSRNQSSVDTLLTNGQMTAHTQTP